MVLGVQAAVGNYADSLEGLQLGFLNIGREVSGLQLGLVNVAWEKGGTQFGLINYARDGVLDVEVYQDELNFTHLLIRSGGKRLYSLIDSGAPAGGGKVFNASYGFGLGLLFKVAGWRFNTEVVGHYLQSKEPEVIDHEGYLRSQILAGHSLFLDRLGWFVGINHNVYFGPEEMFEEQMHPAFTARRTGNRHQSRWFGAQAGIRYSFQH